MKKWIDLLNRFKRLPSVQNVTEEISDATDLLIPWLFVSWIFFEGSFFRMEQDAELLSVNSGALCVFDRWVNQL